MQHDLTPMQKRLLNILENRRRREKLVKAYFDSINENIQQSIQQATAQKNLESLTQNMLKKI